ncbi:MAG: hypothetical protein C4537_02520 [Acholeplasma sp.]|jgi:hypothetical protein|nr:MAG: hypothetical protein C4537_02520 [Acholeplasma sp.]
MLLNKVILWTPRVLSIVLILLMFMLSLDVFESDEVWYLIAAGFLIHNIPVFVLTLALIISWKHPLVGAFIFIAAGIFYSIFMLIRGELDMIGAILSLGVPAILIGILFWLSKKRHLV